MVKKIAVCVFVVFFAFFFSACSRPKPKEESLNLVNLDFEWTQITKGDPFPWDSTDGFYSNEKHKYGFDRYPVSKQKGSYFSIDSIANAMIDSLLSKANDGEIDSTYSLIWNHERGMKNTDSIVYMSILSGDSGKVTLKINQDYGSSSKLYDYYICKPDYPYETIATINNSGEEISYTISSNESVIALCKESEVGLQKVQELYITSYGWQIYDFYVYILGNKDDKSDRHQLLNSTNFWNVFDSVYAQAVVKHDTSRLFGEFKSSDRGYVLTKVKGNYPNSCNHNSDIDNAMKEVRLNARNGGVRRNIIQIGYPTKRFWSLSIENGNVQICGNPAQYPSEFKLVLETLPDSNCSEKIDVSVSRDKYRGIWKLEYKDGKQEDATESNVNVKCMVFADSDVGDYVEEVKTYGNDNTLAVTIPHFELPNVLYPTSVIIQPWLGSSTTKTALHELGHSMGLADIWQVSPSFIEYNNEENNLMVQGGAAKSLKLRQRGILTIDYEGFTGLEFQWNCLHKLKKSCGNLIGEFY